MNVNLKRQSMGINQSAVNRLPGREKAPGREWSKWLLIKGFIVGLLALVLYIPDYAQQVMKICSYIEVERQYDKYIDLVLPTADILASGWIYLEARGADGGLRKVVDAYYNGGEGATLGGWLG
ncbi:MAG: hypothetical protein GY755_15540 [Chloroflexi bacterium]|nr:hypothetical protein [Chloroflexota bacterium]